MADTTRTTYHHGDLERALVDRAFEAVRDVGPSGFSMRKAARELGVDPAAAYRHFANKEALMAAVASRAFSVLARRMEAAMDDAPDLWERLRVVGRAYVRFALDDPGLFRLVFGPLGSGRQDCDGSTRGVGASGRDPYQILLDALGALHDAGQIDVAPSEATLPIWAAIHGLSYLMIDGNVPPEAREEAVERVLAHALRGLRAPG